MDKKRHKRLNSVLQLAEVSENTAAIEFSKAKDSVEFNRSKLEELRTFRDEYREPEKDSVVSPVRLQSTRQFLSQLSNAIDQQESQVDEMLNRMASDELVWNERRIKRKSIEKLIEKRLDENLKQEAKLEQKQLDEMRKPSLRN